MKATWVRLCAMVVTIGIIAASCGVATVPAADETTDEAGAPTVEEVYRGLGQTLKQPGSIFHSAITIEMSAGLLSHTATMERWVDAEHDVAREDATFKPTDGTEQKSVKVIANGGTYRNEHGGVSVTQPLSCHGATPAISLVLGCPGPPDQSTTTVETGQYEAKSVIILVTNGTSHGSDERLTFTDRLHLDPDSYLPIALERDGTIDFGETVPARGKWIFVNEFVPADSLPEDFFDPASIGYVEHDPAEPLIQTDWGIPIYWLGRETDEIGDLPPLILGLVEVPQYPAGPDYQFNLQYRRADDPYGPPVLTIEEWSTSEWDRNDTANRTKMPPIWDNPCWQRESLTLPEGRATIYSGYSPEVLHSTSTDTSSSGAACPAQPRDRFMAHVELGPTFLVIEAPRGRVLGKTGTVLSPYESRKAMEAVVRALQPFSGS